MGSSVRSLREPEESLNACLLDKGSCSMQRVCGQRIIGHTEKGIIPGVCLGSSAANALSFAFVLQVGR